jgi:hypothetical protein
LAVLLPVQMLARRLAMLSSLAARGVTERSERRAIMCPLCLVCTNRYPVN